MYIILVKFFFYTRHTLFSIDVEICNLLLFLFTTNNAFNKITQNIKYKRNVAERIF